MSTLPFLPTNLYLFLGFLHGVLCWSLHLLTEVPFPLSYAVFYNLDFKLLVVPNNSKKKFPPNEFVHFILRCLRFDFLMLIFFIWNC